MQEILLCSGNMGKVAELRALLPSDLRVLTADEMGLRDLPEDGTTFEENALQKAEAAFNNVGIPCLADDSGLEVTALNGAPGVFSARFAGEQKDDLANMEKLLEELAAFRDRSAVFRTVLAFVDGKEKHMFQGEVKGTIALRPRGKKGFGYDPIFIPEDGHGLTFAEMEPLEKNAISHRGKALRLFVAFIYDHPERFGS